MQEDGWVTYSGAQDLYFCSHPAADTDGKLIQEANSED
jgi:hypothetical protein